MCNLVMSFDSEVDFVRAVEYFETTNYDYEPDNQNRRLSFPCKKFNGAELMKSKMENSILYEFFEYDTFTIE